MKRGMEPRTSGPAAYWSRTGAELLADLGSGAAGLSQAEADRRLVSHGENSFAVATGAGVLRLLLR